MTRSQITALLLGAGIVAVLAGLIWRGVLPGLPPTSPATSNGAPTASQQTAGSPTPAAGPSAATPANQQAASSPEPAKPQQEAATQPNATPNIAAPAQPETAPAPPAVPTGPDIPVFDTVRVEPSGDTVIAGHGAPDAKIELVAGDKVIAEVDADGAGNFVIIPPPLAPGNYVLALRSTGKDGVAIDSHQNVAVSVPPKGQKNVVVALAEPGKPSVVLTDTAKPAEPNQAPRSASAPAVPAQPEVAFKTAEVDNGGFYASGTATPGSHLRIYLNGTALADVTAGSDGHWSLTVGKGMTPGHFSVRADAIDESGKVLARAEVPFDVPVSVAEADAPAANPAQTAPPAAAPQPAAAQPTPTPEAPASSEPAPTPQTSASSEPAPTPPQISASSEPAPTPETPASSEPAPTPQTPASSEPAPRQSMGSTAPETSAAGPAPAGELAKESGQQEAAAAPSRPAPSANDVVVPEIQTTTVVRGDCLWRISRKVFGHGIRYTLIYEANLDQIRDPNLIYPGQIFVLPHVTN